MHPNFNISTLDKIATYKKQVYIDILMYNFIVNFNCQVCIYSKIQLLNTNDVDKRNLYNIYTWYTYACI